MDYTIDRALTYAVLKGGLPAYQKARESGIESAHLKFEDQQIFKLIEEIFLPRGKMPSLAELRINCGIDLPEAADEFDVEICSKDIVKRALSDALNNGLGPIAEMVWADPYGARDKIGELIQATNWSAGTLVRTNSPAVIEEIKRRYLEAKSRTGSLLGYSSPWPSRDKQSLGLQAGEVSVVLAKRKTGKTLAASTLMHDPVTGRPTTIESVVRERKGSVFTWSQNTSITAVAPNDYIDAGVKACLRITWRSGRFIDAAPTHPFRTTTGWTVAGELAVGQHTVAVRLLPEPLKTIALPEAEIKVLAYLTADGGVTNGIVYTKYDQDLVSDLRCAVEDYYHCEMSSSLRGVYNISGGGGANPVRDVLNRHAVLGKKSVDKTIPDAIFSLDDGQLGIFLGCLWSGDGCVDARGNVSYSTGSKQMASQIQHLLLRFGITTRVREIYRNNAEQETRTYYEVLVHKECIESFRTNIKLVGEKATRLRDVRFEGKSRVGWLKNEELRDAIQSEMNAAPQLLQEVGEELGYEFKFQKGHVFDSKSGRIRKKVFAAFCDVYDSPLKWVLDENIWWDEIESIESIGPQQVYDLSIPETHCFVANDFVVHNSWMVFKWAEHIWTAKLADGSPELKPNECILIVTMEMPVWQVLRRFFAINQKLNYEEFRAGRLTKGEEDKYFAWSEDMKKPSSSRPDVIVVGSDKVRTVRDIIALCAQYRPKVVFIDGFYILGSEKGAKAAPMWERVETNIKDIKLELAVKMNLPVVATTQLSGQVKRGDLNAEADAVAYAKSIGNYADSIDGLFGNDKFRDSRKRILRGMEARDFVTVDLEINFDPGTQNYSEIKVVDSKTGDGSGDEDDDDDDDNPGGAPAYTDSEITLD